MICPSFDESFSHQLCRKCLQRRTPRADPISDGRLWAPCPACWGEAPPSPLLGLSPRGQLRDAVPAASHPRGAGRERTEGEPARTRGPSPRPRALAFPPEPPLPVGGTGLSAARRSRLRPGLRSLVHSLVLSHIQRLGGSSALEAPPQAPLHQGTRPLCAQAGPATLGPRRLVPADVVRLPAPRRRALRPYASRLPSASVSPSAVGRGRDERPSEEPQYGAGAWLMAPAAVAVLWP